MDCVLVQVRELFDSIGEGDVHGTAHALKVMEHAKNALKEVAYAKKLHTEQHMAVLYAALLHDVDDSKIFPKSVDYQNARKILASIHFSDIELVITMIRLVSFSKNHNTGAILDLSGMHGRSCVSQQYPSWMYIPRDADRIEALGIIGIVRCISYGVEIDRPMYTRETPRITTRKELYVTSAKYLLTGNYPATSIDYFIAGLIPRRIMASQCRYFERLANDAILPIENFCLMYGTNGAITPADLQNLCIDDTQLLTILQDHHLL
jgi:hypothetical protein